MKKVMVMMSGGVDSSVSALLLKEMGYDVVGVHLVVCDYKGEEYGKCCSPVDAYDARRSADKMGIPFYVFNVKEIFREKVIEPFAEEYLRGRTPNPCVLCNAWVKFKYILRRARAIGFDYLATGHYARIVNDNGTFRLKKAKDEARDQSYFLFILKQEEMRYILFPLGEMIKRDVRYIAKKAGLSTFKKKESRGICFIPDGKHWEFLKEYRRVNGRGEVVDLDGNVIGYHEGYYRYTIGQREGLGVAVGRKLYVVDIDSERKRVVVGDEKNILKNSAILENFNWVSEESSKPFRASAKIRYKHHIADCTVYPDGEIVKVVFDEPQRAITPGQACVVYKEDEVVGGGWIKYAE